MKNYSSWILLFLFPLCSFAHTPQEGTVHLVAGPYIQSTQVQRSVDPANSPVYFGMGIFGQADTSSHGGVELGLLYFKKTYQRAFGTTHIVERTDKLSIPMGYRYWFFSQLSLSLAFTASFSVGEFQTVYSDTTVGNVTSARDASELGGDVSLQWEFWKENKFSAIFDARYYYSFSAKSGEDANIFSGLFGVKYLLQDK